MPLPPIPQKKYWSVISDAPIEGARGWLEGGAATLDET
jgi:hypothetical protein